MKPRNHSVFLLIGLLSVLGLQASCLGQGTAFTYQGQLNDSGAPANGSYDFTFGLWTNANGAAQVGGTITNLAASVSNGAFVVTLDFGSNFPGAGRWLEIGVRTNGGGSFSTVSPRQKITAAPYAITAGQMTGTLPGASLSGVYGNAVSLTNTANQFTGNGGGLTNVTAVKAGTATNFSGSLAGNVTGTQGSTVVAAVGAQSAANVVAAVNAVNSATFNNEGSTIVERNFAGDFSTGTITLDGNLTLPITTTNTGIIYSSSVPVMHTFGINNYFAGRSAGNFTLTGNNDTGTGAGALAGLSSGTGNTAHGSFALFDNTSGNYNTAVGDGALGNNLAGNNNTAVGEDALQNTTGNGNIALGFFAGLSVAGGSNNIEIGNQGFSADNNTIRVGTETTQTSCFIAGIFGRTTASGVPVLVNGTGQLGTTTSSARFKQDIEDMGAASDVLLALRPVTFHYKTELDPQGLAQFGLIAEEVEKLDPDLVVRDAQDRPYSVRYEAVNAMLLNEFLKQHRRIEEQNREIEALKKTAGQVESLEQRLEELQRAVEQIGAPK